VTHTQLLVFLTFACLAPLSMSTPADPELDRALATIHLRTGSPPDLRQRDQALTWLLRNEARAFDTVLARALAAPDDAVLIDLLGRYRRAEATPALLRAFDSARARPYAAIGLGQSPDPAAQAALKRLAAEHADPTARSLAAEQLHR
jgi:hypothetical protein